MFETAAVPRVSSPSFCFSSSAVSRCGVEVLEGGERGRVKEGYQPEANTGKCRLWGCLTSHFCQ